MSDANVRGRFLWHELMTTDTKAAAAFYKQVAGWGTENWPHDPSYTLFVARKAPRAGLMILPPEAKAMGAPPNWMTYIGAPNVDETSRLAQQFGGRVLRQPADIPNVGRFSVLADPQGAVFAAYKSNQDGGGDDTPGLGDFSWHELATTDWQSAFDFYSRLFGWEKTESMDMGPDMGVYQMFGSKGRTVGGMYNKPANVAAPPHWLPYIKVVDSKRAAQRTTQLGGRVVNGPMQVPGGDWITMGIDPQGAVFAVHSVTPAAKQAAPAAKPKKAAAKRAKAAKRKPARKAKPAKRKAAKKSTRRPKSARRKAAGKSRPRRPVRKSAAKKKGGARKKRR